MARGTKPSKSMTSVAPARTSGRPAGAAAKAPVQVSRPTAAPKRSPDAALVVPKPSKDELRAQVVKLESANATLRARSREATRAAKTAATRIAELEDQVAQLEKQLSALRRDQRKSRDIDPGDAVPPGVAVQEPAPLDKEAETALENLTEHLGGES